MAKLQVIDRSEEKLVLARELNLDGYVIGKAAEEESKKEAKDKEEAIKELTSMKFKPLTEKDFRFFPKFKLVKLIRNEWDMPIVLKSFFCSFFGFFGLMVSLLIMKKFNIKNNNVAYFGSVTSYLLSIGVATFFHYFRFAEVNVASMPLSLWRDELPYGAFLAIKEAKNAGIKGVNVISAYTGNMIDIGYKIYYPKAEERVKADPIITGMYKGVEVVIFAWDDSKVYE